MNKIVKLQVNLPMHTELYIVGEVPCVITQKGKRRDDLVITEIVESTIECPTSIHKFYNVYANGQLYRRIEYSPVTVEYEVK